MDILVNVVNQKLKIATNLKTYISGTQKFIRFVFNLVGEWDNLTTFAQFSQNGVAYNQYLDENNSVYLPPEIKPGTCTLILFGNDGETIALSDFLTLTINENILVEDAQSTVLSKSLYDQIIAQIREFEDRTNERVAQIINENIIFKDTVNGWLQEHDDEVSILDSRVSNLINELTANPDYAPTAEVIDIRSGYDGTVYQTAGDAVRALGIKIDQLKIITHTTDDIDNIETDGIYIIPSGCLHFEPTSDTGAAILIAAKAEYDESLSEFIQIVLPLLGGVYTRSKRIAPFTGGWSSWTNINLSSEDKIKIDNAIYTENTLSSNEIIVGSNTSNDRKARSSGYSITDAKSVSEQYYQIETSADDTEYKNVQLPHTSNTTIAYVTLTARLPKGGQALLCSAASYDSNSSNTHSVNIYNANEWTTFTLDSNGASLHDNVIWFSISPDTVFDVKAISIIDDAGNEVYDYSAFRENADRYIFENEHSSVPTIGAVRKIIEVLLDEKKSDSSKTLTWGSIAGKNT